MAAVIARVLLVLESTGDEATSLLDLARWAQAERGVEVVAVVLSADTTRWGKERDEPDVPGVASVRRPTPTVGAFRTASDITGRTRAVRRAERAWRRRVLSDAAEFDVVIAGSAAALEALDDAASPRPPVVAHLPLLDETWAGRHGKSDLRRRLAGVALTVLPAAPVAEWATRERRDGGLGLDPARVRHHPGPVDPPTRHPRPARDSAALVVGCGAVGWRGGTDLFLALADAVGDEVAGRELRWTWIGGDDDDGTAADVHADRHLRGTDRVRIIPDGPDRADRLAAADLLVVTWREGPYPLPAVQAALAGTPVIGFGPGTALLAEAGHDERRVDRLDVDALAAEVVSVLSDADAARLLAGDLARAAAGATTPLAAATLWAAIEDVVAPVVAQRRVALGTPVPAEAPTAATPDTTAAAETARPADATPDAANPDTVADAGEAR